MGSTAGTGPAGERSTTMADAALLVRWERPVAGREQQALSLFGSALEYYGALQADGVIESFEPVLLHPSSSNLNGFIILRGDAERLDAHKRDERFLDIMTRGEHFCAAFGIVDASIGAELQARMTRYAQIIAL